MTFRQYIPTYDAKRLGFECSVKTISIEASEAGIRPGRSPHAQIYTDALDEGVKLHNPETGEESVWYFTSEDKQEGDIMGWRYAPTPESLRKHPKLEGWTLLIIND